MDHVTIPCGDLNEAVEFFTTRLGFRVDMIFPADEPSVALISGHGVGIRLERPAVALAAAGDIRTQQRPEARRDAAAQPIISRSEEAKWISGRAGMEYRDLIPGRLDGRLIASLIRLPGGAVADYVHYHKVRFQMIYCWHGRVRVVYEGQGEPFWLHPGDCVLQPPEIRHRVLEASEGAQVIELTSPGSHETWADHDMTLPTAGQMPERDFGGQMFVRRKVSDSTIMPGEFGGFESHHFGIATATGGTVRVIELRSPDDHSAYASDVSNPQNTFLFLLAGRLDLSLGSLGDKRFTPGDCILVPPYTPYEISANANAEVLLVNI